MDLFQLSAPLSPFDAHDYDVHRLKTILNHAGYYTPPPDTGIEETREPALFEALSRFRRDRGLPDSPWLMPHDATMSALNAAAKEINPTTRYIWRTVGDERVRDSHEDREGQIFL